MPTNTANKDGDSGSNDPSVGIYRPEPGGAVTPAEQPAVVREIGGRKDGTEPTRFGDWEKQGRCIDF